MWDIYGRVCRVSRVRVSVRDRPLVLGLWLCVGLSGRQMAEQLSRTIAKTQDSLALASMARDDPPASSTAAAMRGKVGSEFET